jgi:EAL domain-containing protein (putative c-di-GMP-specific phosphodiesterase class I)
MSLTGPDQGLDVAVNLSTCQLAEPDLIAHVRDALATSGLPAERLVLEVTESAVMQDEQIAATALDALSSLGVRIAIDDFGTGYSSLLYLRRYPISALKIDRAFVSGIGVSPDDEAICSSVVSLANAVGATSIGEGVETVDQYAALRAFGCQQAQGFLWSPAVPIVDLPRVLLACRDIPVPLAAPRDPQALKQIDPEIARRITALHRSGASLQTIAANLNRDATRSPGGLLWTANDIAGQLVA